MNEEQWKRLVGPMTIHRGIDDLVTEAIEELDSNEVLHVPLNVGEKQILQGKLVLDYVNDNLREHMMTGYIGRLSGMNYISDPWKGRLPFRSFRYPTGWTQGKWPRSSSMRRAKRMRQPCIWMEKRFTYVEEYPIEMVAGIYQGMTLVHDDVKVTTDTAIPLISCSFSFDYEKYEGLKGFGELTGDDNGQG